MTEAMHRVAGEARTIEQRLAHSDWVVGESFSAADMVIYPDIRLLLRALQRPEAHELAARFLPMEINYPAIGRWLERVAAFPGTNAPGRHTGAECRRWRAAGAGGGAPPLLTCARLSRPEPA